MAEREQYARGHAVVDAIELHIGVEIRDGEDLDRMSSQLRAMAEDMLNAARGNHWTAVHRVEAFIAVRWPGEERAYFIETDERNRGLQVYQPYGRPRAA